MGFGCNSTLGISDCGWFFILVAIILILFFSVLNAPVSIF